MIARRVPAGFTLIEAIVAIVVTGILSAIVATFIARPVEGYVDAVRRAELTDAADLALRRITRDLRLALPNSLRVTNAAGMNYIEFIMTSAGGRYRDPGDGSTGGDFLSFADPLDLTFNVLGTMPANPAIVANDFVVVFNLGPGYSPADAYQRGAAACDATPAAPGCNIAQVVSVAGNTITLDANPFASQTPPLPSPTNRFQVIPGGVRAVTYACPDASGTLTRYWNYGFNAAQPTPPAGGSSAVVATGARCAVSYTTGGTGRNGVLFVQLTLASGDESVTLFHQIHMDNSP